MNYPLISHAKDWRYDIEGLRALAILPVLLYHFDPVLIPGGFLGVDLFFVISGYLITKILFTNHHYLGSFSGIASFLKRRILRIFPTIIIWFILFSIIFSCILSKKNLDAFYLTPITAFLGVSNIYLDLKKINYFSPQAELNPFLHSWSISVEDQFYLCFALICFLLIRIKTILKYRNILFLIAIGASFLISLKSGPANPSHFYFLSSRVFEFLAGSAAFGLFSQIGRNPIFSIIRFASLVGILFFYFNISDKTVTNAHYAVFCILSSILLIKSTEKQGLNYCFSLPLFRYIGRLSFSLYVVHYPVLKFLEYFIDVSAKNWSALFIYGILIGLLSIFNYSYIEFHFINNSKNTSAIFAWNKIFTSITTSICILYLVHIIPFYSLNQITYTRLAPPIVKNYTQPGNKQLIVLGDSHAQQLFPAFEKISQLDKISIINQTGTACFLSEDLTYIAADGKWQNQCHNHLKKVFNQIYQSSPSTDTVLFMGMRSLAYLSPILISKADNPVLGLQNHQGQRFPNIDTTLMDLYFMSLEKTVNKLNKINMKIVFLSPLPEMYSSTEHCIYNARKKTCRVLKQRNILAREYFMSKLIQLKNKYPNLYLLDIFDGVCPHKFCHNIEDGVMVFRDDDHLSKEMVIKLTPSIREQLRLAFVAQ
ncbi:acyltransferase [Fluoribacter gormanii]|uniref:acyltransferase family protein n=1 Tax=Fluoribacter gormanii TaxID=464 RepID=UPI002243229A|nr:acyltransferase family protein [Fluoribacter gormanii]MCW8445062.1 acyltransferase [Fluoribacter gormanii]MCW8470272.1 acyltransferase [Fluoribacter gormanii]